MSNGIVSGADQKLSHGHEKILSAHWISGAHRGPPGAFQPAMFLCGDDSTRLLETPIWPI